MAVQILIEGEIGREPGEVSASYVKQQLAAARGQPVEIVIDSEGGSVFEGFGIYDLIQGYSGPTSTIIQGCAFSIASLIAVASDRVEISPTGWMMIHGCHGPEDEPVPGDLLSKLDGKMAQRYSERSGMPINRIQSLMAQETFMDSEDAVRLGFVDSITNRAWNTRVAAKMQKTLKSYPAFQIAAKLKADSKQTYAQRWRARVANAMMANGGHRLRAIAQVDRDVPALRQQMIAEANKR